MRFLSDMATSTEQFDVQVNPTIYPPLKKESAVNHPAHYNAHPSGVECITIAEGFDFNLGNAIKYIWRAGLKSENATQDLQKALWYLQREIDRLNPETRQEG